jgi:hypothetical protein
MWDLQMSFPLGKLTKRNILLFVTTLIVTAFAYLLIATPNAYAADATWKGASIVYEGNQYIGPTNARGDESYKLPAGSQIFNYTEQLNNSQNTQKVHFIYFDKGVDTTKATSAKYVEYNYTPPDAYSNPSNMKAISLDSSGYGQGGTQCAVSGGLGYLLCPISNTLANAMDLVYGFIAGFMTVQPIQSGQHSTLYVAWDVIRGIANIAFVITFLIIIYSQLTSFGISNYGIKKLLPRLIVAAVLVNLSYYISAAAIDLSNIIGSSLHDLLYGLRDSLFNRAPGGANTPDASYSWSSVIGVVLSGGTAVTAGVVGAGLGVIASGGTIAGMIYLLLPLMLGFFITVLVVLLILAARQAIIITLLIVSPLAFVAYLLPGTEKLFDKWRELFATMLVFFPAFSLVFGGAQLAGSLIMQNATSFNMIILGMAIQVAPLAIAPLLLKLSGGLLSRVAGIVNNPKKGLMDRTRAWSNERAEMHRQRGLGDDNGKPVGAMRGFARYWDSRGRRVKERTSNYSAMSDNRYNRTSQHAEQDLIRRDVAEQKEAIEKQLDITWNAHVKLDTHAIEQDLKLRVLSDQAALGKAYNDTRYEEFKAGVSPMRGLGLHGPETQSMVDLLNQSTDTTQHLALTAMRKQSAESVQKSRLASDLLRNSNQIEGKSLQEFAGGIDEHGANSALATAVSIDRKQYGDRVAEADAILKHFNVSGKDRQAHAMGNTVTLTDNAGNVKILDNTSTFTQEAAIEAQLAGAGNMENIEEIISNSGGSLANFKTTISQAMVKNGIAAKAAYWGGKSIDDVAQGNINGPGAIKFVATRAIAQGKIKPTLLATMDQLAIKNIRDAAMAADATGLGPDDAAALTAQIRELQRSAYEALTSDALKGNVAQNVKPILEEIMGSYTPPSTP